MTSQTIKLGSPPIIEAVIDIDCDMPPQPDIEALDTAAKSAMADHYPIARRRWLSGHAIASVDSAPASVIPLHGLQAMQYLTADERQIVQWRPNGFSFNRLAPYGSLDDYLPEIERTWRIFVIGAAPVICRMVRLRYINRLLLPLREDGRVELNDYLAVSPRPADEGRFTFAGFVSQQSMIDNATGALVNVLLTTQQQQPQELNKVLPIIFDIEVFQGIACEPGDWHALSGRIMQLRALKNDVFRQSLTERCLNLYRP